MLSVLITRPKAQSFALTQLLQAENIPYLLFPCIEIQAISVKTIDLKPFDLAIFISINAVHYAVKYFKIFPAEIAAIGPATKQALQAKNIPVTIYPDQDFNSEALLNCQALQSVKNKKITIFAGRGGNDLLEKTLSARGAQVKKIELYQRVLPQIDFEKIWSAWQAANINTIVSTSLESLNNLWQLVPSTKHAWLCQNNLIVVSSKMLQQAQQLGFNKSFQAKNASTAAIFTLLKQIAKTQ